MSRKDKQIAELYDHLSEMHFKVRALELLLLQVSTLVNQEVKPLGPINDARFYMLRNAAARGDWNDVDIFIAADASILDATNGLEETALHFLVVENRLEAVRGLAERGCDVNGKSTSFSPIADAALLGHVEMVELLTELGAKIEDEELLLQMAENREGKKGRKQLKTLLKRQKSKARQLLS